MNANVDTAARQPIERHLVLELKLGADSRREMASALKQLAFEIFAEMLVAGEGASGGVGSGYTWQLRVNEGVTHESYFEAINQMLKQRREEQDGAPTDER